ncbi:MAG: hypothetical protein CVV23_02455 [Ignavibacteriae bacterium HGW-Ignavibacteriae-2]|jgi:hypothetical protein|nr:MAG: hypothetical protein CVV23_02455 [Ignavibacteriae bacterium HGW-Ignavibacteriae-2]
MHTEPKVVIILLNFNQQKNICECLESLSKINYKNFQTILIDNCSTDNSWSFLIENYPDLLKFKTDENSGYTGGVNFGFKKAQEFNADYVLVLNPDTLVTENFLTALVNGLENDISAAAAGGLILTEHDKEKIWYAGGKLVPWRGLAVHFQKGEILKNIKITKIEYVNFLTGCMILFRVDLLKQIGEINEKFFLYLEDIEISARMIKKGFKLLYIPDSIIYHKVFGEEDDIMKLYYSVRNRLLLINIMNKGLIRIISNLYFVIVIHGKLIYWRFMNKQFFVAASKGLDDYYTNNFHKGNGLDCFYK